MSNQTRIIFNYRTQYIANGQAFATPMASVIMPWVKGSIVRKGALGLSLIQDRTGEGGMLSTTGALFTFAPNIDLTANTTKDVRTYLSLGIQGGYFQRRISVDALTAGVQWTGSVYDSSIPINEDLLNANANFPIFNGGAMLYWADSCADLKAYLGVSAQNVNRPDVGFLGYQATEPVQWMLVGGVNVLDNDLLSLQPNVRWLRNTSSNQIRMGLTAFYKMPNGASKVGVSAWYDNNQLVSIGAQFYHNNFMLGFGADLGVSRDIRSIGSGALELALGIQLGKRCLQARLPKEEERPRELIQDTISGEVAQGENTLKFTILRQKTIEGEIISQDTLQRELVAAALLIPTEEDLKAFKKQAFFYYISSDINKSTQSILDEIALKMQKFRGIKIEVMGHTCDIGGSEDDNQALSLTRAEVTKQYLVSKGIKSERIKITGFGSTRPILANKGEYERSKNRRVEFKVLETGGEKKN